MRTLLLPLALLAGCAVPSPSEMPDGIVCVSTLTTTVVTVANMPGTVTIMPDCTVRIE